MAKNNYGDYTVSGMYREKLNFRDFSKVCFCTRCKTGKQFFGGCSRCGNFRKSENLRCDDKMTNF